MSEGLAAAQPRNLRWVFFGSDGLRAGWRVTAFFAVAVIVYILIVVVSIAVAVALALHFLGGPAVQSAMAGIARTAKAGALGSPELAALSELYQVVAALFATLIMGWFEGRRLASYGFRLRGALPRFVQGAIVGFSTLTVTILALWYFKGISFDGPGLRGPGALVPGAEWAGVFLLVGAAEEFTMRCYFLQTLARGLNFRWAALITSMTFMAAHVPNAGEAIGGLASVFLVGLVYSFSIWRTGTVWWAVGCHAAWDWAETFVFGVADSGNKSRGALLVTHPIGPAWLSGGTVGPEGSLLIPIVMAATAAIIIFTLKKPDQNPGVNW